MLKERWPGADAWAGPASGGRLRYFYERYQAILAEREEAESWTDVVRSQRFLEDRRVYYDYIESARDRAVEAAQRLRELQALRRELTSEVYEEWDRRMREARGL